MAKTLEEKLDALVADHHEAKDRLTALEAELAGIDEEVEALPELLASGGQLPGLVAHNQAGLFVR
jgi:predicted  nucleic acid-binding Zn-ribbon protein